MKIVQAGLTISRRFGLGVYASCCVFYLGTFSNVDTGGILYKSRSNSHLRARLPPSGQAARLWNGLPTEPRCLRALR